MQLSFSMHSDLIQFMNLGHDEVLAIAKDFVEMVKSMKSTKGK